MQAETALDGSPIAAALPDLSAENLGLRRRFVDGYYDLARSHTDHLEDPWWVSPVAPGETVGQVFARLAATAPRILAGEQVSRPLAFDEHVHGGVEPSEFRGGSTFIFDLDALRDVPNSVPDLDGRETRRSDMIWALLNHHVHGRAIVRAPLPVFHDRSVHPRHPPS